LVADTVPAFPTKSIYLPEIEYYNTNSLFIKL